MNNKVALKFAFKNLKANKILVLPFLISSIVMASLFFIMISLQLNDYVLTRHKNLIIPIKFGMVLVAIFTFVFMIYANRFLTKRRNKEFALYGIMGLEKKHISKIIALEYLFNYIVVSFFSVVGGFVFGKLSFLILNKFMRDYTVKVMEYKISMGIVVTTIIFLFIIFLFMYGITLFSIGKSTPVELLLRQKRAEKEPKSKFLITLIGFGLLGYGYYLALTTKGTISAINIFFVAVLFVIFGTYFLFTAFSILVLKFLKSRRNFYYKDKNFISISGMLYRMKSNAVGLASIAILSTSIIVTLTGTLTVNSGMKEIVNAIMKKDYLIGNGAFIEIYKGYDEVRKEKEKMKSLINSTVKEDEKIKDLLVEETATIFMMKEGNKFLILDTKNKTSESKPYYCIVNLLENYNIKHNKDIKLKDDEILFISNDKEISVGNEVTMLDKTFNLKFIEDDISKNIGTEAIRVVVKDYETMTKFLEYYLVKNSNGEGTPRVNISGEWNVENAKEDYRQRANNNLYSKFGNLEAKVDREKTVYELNGGMLFLGIVIGIMFLVGNVLITYYKQISEGYEDRESFQIMKKVGLPDKLIQKSSRVQILWMFFLPLVVACIHCLFATKILFQLLGIFGTRNFSQYLMNFGIVVGFFAIIYLIVYLITSKIYYKIVS